VPQRLYFLERAQISERPQKSISKRDSKRCCLFDRVVQIHTLRDNCTVSDEKRMAGARSSNCESFELNNIDLYWKTKVLTG